MRIDLLRHGETTLGHTLRGSTDDDLTALGWSQMQQAISPHLNPSLNQNPIQNLSQDFHPNFPQTHTQFLKVYQPHAVAKLPQWDVVFSSPLKRCRLFADHISQQLQLELFIDSHLQEMHFGDWEGRSTQTIYENEPELLANFWQQPSLYTPPNAESMQHFQQRIMRSIENMQYNMQEKNWQHALVITHGGVIKLLKCMALDQPLDNILKMTAELGQLNCFRIDQAGALHLLKPEHVFKQA